MGKHTIMVIFGTRPEAIKMCPLIIELKKHLELNVIVCVTGQHRELLDQVLDCFGVPTIGLDIWTKEAMRELIQRINRERGVTIILTSHDLKDVENICQRIIVIDDGRVVCDKGIQSLAKEYSMDRGLLLTLSETQQGLLEKVRSLDGISYAVMEEVTGYTTNYSSDWSDWRIDEGLAMQVKYMTITYNGIVKNHVPVTLVKFLRDTQSPQQAQ